MEYDLSRLDPATFQRMVNALARKVLGPGLQAFSAGRDGGRDAWFQGEAPYPSTVDRWSGVWYVQSKYFSGTPGTDPQKWLQAAVKEELRLFQATQSKRVWPDNWIVATNVDISAVPVEGTFDTLRTIVSDAHPKLGDRFHIWGAQAISDWLSNFSDVATRYGHYLTSGHVLAAILETMTVERATFEQLVRSLTTEQLRPHECARLEQAGSTEDAPPLHDVFVDLPYKATTGDRSSVTGLLANSLYHTCADNHAGNVPDEDDPWLALHRAPDNAPVWLIKAGPGHGKTTIGHYMSQVFRAACALQTTPLSWDLRTLCNNIRSSAETLGVWPRQPRIPIVVTLKKFAERVEKTPHVLQYLAEDFTAAVGQEVTVGRIREWLPHARWFVCFDGLDEVPQSKKEHIALQILNFLEEFRSKADLVVLCTTRPQGYAGQFDGVPDAAHIELLPLSAEQSLKCAERVLQYKRSDAVDTVAILREALQNDSIRNLMSTPLHAHIMAVLVRGGKQPPARRWNLFDTFYDVIYSREAAKGLADRTILREHPELIRIVHNRLGFVLHARSEVLAGANATMTKTEFLDLVTEAATAKLEARAENVARAILDATTQRLVLISTPEDGESVRFDIRQLQEYFAASFLVTADAAHIEDRLRVIVEDSHWREVVLFLLSGLAIEKSRERLRTAIGVLRALENNESPELDAYARAMGVGPRLALGLAYEGSLETDKTIRAEFKEFLARFLGNAPFQSQFFFRIRGVQLRSWFIQRASEHIRENGVEASTGAVNVLIQLLEDDDPNLPWLTEEILAHKSIAFYISQSLEIQGRPKAWHVNLIAKVIRSPLERFDSLLFAIIEMQRNARERVDTIASLSEQLETNERPLFEFVTAFPHSSEVDPSTALRLSKHESPFFVAARAYVSFLRHPDGPGLRTLRDALGGWDSLRYLPGHTSRSVAWPWTTVPIEDEEAILNFDAHEYRAFLDRILAYEELRWRTIGVATQGIYREPKLFNRALDIDAGTLLGDWEFYNHVELVDLVRNEAIVGCLLDRLDPIFARLIPPHIWGCLVRANSKSLDVLAAACSSRDWLYSLRRHHHREFADFKFSAAQVALLPAVICGLGYTCMFQAGSGRTVLRTMGEQLGHMVEAKGWLDDVARDEAVPNDIRASAVLARSVCLGGKEGTEALRNRCDVLEAVAHVPAFGPAVAMTLDELDLERETFARILVGRFLQREPYSWSRIFVRWREKAVGAVSAAEVQSRWLTENVD